jgi:hypothetical protein
VLLGDKDTELRRKEFVRRVYNSGSSGGSPGYFCDAQSGSITSRAKKSWQRAEDLLWSGDLRSPFRWNDTVCIHQEDNHERSEQVRMMKTIYEKAHHVCA